MGEGLACLYNAHNRGLDDDRAILATRLMLYVRLLQRRHRNADLAHWTGEPLVEQERIANSGGPPRRCASTPCACRKTASAARENVFRHREQLRQRSECAGSWRDGRLLVLVEGQQNHGQACSVVTWMSYDFLLNVLMKVALPRLHDLRKRDVQSLVEWPITHNQAARRTRTCSSQSSRRSPCRTERTRQTAACRSTGAPSWR